MPTVNDEDIARAYMVQCEEYNWTPSLTGLSAYFRIVHGGYRDKWCSIPTRKEPTQ